MRTAKSLIFIIKKLGGRGEWQKPKIGVSFDIENTKDPELKVFRL
jgi:hypothetical protein